MEGLNINTMNSLHQTHAMTIWIPIFEHSSDFGNEIMTLKKFPFQVKVRVDPQNGDEGWEDLLQTYIEIDNSVNNVHQQSINIVGTVIRGHSQFSKLPLDNNCIVSACLRLGCQYINHQCKECIEPNWIRTDIGQQSQIALLEKKFQQAPRFNIIKNGVHF